VYRVAICIEPLDRISACHGNDWFTAWSGRDVDWRGYRTIRDNFGSQVGATAIMAPFLLVICAGNVVWELREDAYQDFVVKGLRASEVDLCPVPGQGG